MLGHLSKIFDKIIGSDFEAVARWWISNKKNVILNTCCAALMWCIWTTRNDLCFQGVAWRNEKVMMIKLIKTLKRWRVVCKNADLQEFDRVVEDLKTSLHQPLRIAWGGPSAASSSSQMGIQSSSAPSTGQMSQNESSTSATTTEEMSELIQETIFPSSDAAVADSSVFYPEPVMPSV